MAGTPGTFIAIPGDCEHSFTVDDPDTHLLNFYLPGGFEQALIGVSHPAETREPPPPELIAQMLPPRWLSAKLSADYGVNSIYGDPFVDPPDPNKMSTRPTPGASEFPFTANPQDLLPSYWLEGGLWTMLAVGNQTGSRYSLAEVRHRAGSIIRPRLYTGSDNIFYVLRGNMTFFLEDRIESGSTGAFVFIPRGTIHSVRADNDDVHFLNLQTPGGPEKLTVLMGTPNAEKIPPPVSFTAKDVNAATIRRLTTSVGVRCVAVADPPDETIH